MKILHHLVAKVIPVRVALINNGTSFLEYFNSSHNFDMCIKITARIFRCAAAWLGKALPEFESTCNWSYFDSEEIELEEFELTKLFVIKFMQAEVFGEELATLNSKRQSLRADASFLVCSLIIRVS